MAFPDNAGSSSGQLPRGLFNPIGLAKEPPRRVERRSGANSSDGSINEGGCQMRKFMGEAEFFFFTWAAGIHRADTAGVDSKVSER